MANGDLPQSKGSNAWIWVLLGCGGAMVLLLVAVVAMAILLAPRNVHRLSRNESATIGSMRAYASAQAMFHRNDWDADGKLEYATPYTLLSTQPDGNGDAVNLIDQAMAAAQGKGGVPKYGYVFKDMATVGGKKIDWVNNFAFCAIPANYGRSCRRTFIVAADGTVYAKDLGRPTAFVSDYPVDPAAAGWVIAE